MNRKPFTLRQAVLCGAAVAAGSTVGTVAETVASHVPSIGPLTTAAVALWVLDKLNALIDDTKS
ncbi:hypothetical protein [Streptomyces sp. NBC_01006]|uniref:hypothetical protein n=1 Tax=Streptomyces sp. NBC_01006 TaxID=2903716 RepID=UPI0038664761|nr:hypothetical protein OG509_37795 [Streptomyces sp. NBC_01006]